MPPWQIPASEKLTAFLKPYGTTSLKGSVTTPSELDIYSDVDIDISTPDNTPIDIKSLITKTAEHFGSKVFGYEAFIYERQDVIRLCLENGYRFDITFNYPSAKEIRPACTPLEAVVNQFWFMAVMVLVKQGRKDNLIAAHLALELCQLIIVIQMLARDEAKGTNIYRFGDDEDVPILRAMAGVSVDTDSLLRLAVLYMDGEKADVLFTSASPLPATPHTTPQPARPHES